MADPDISHKILQDTRLLSSRTGVRPSRVLALPQIYRQWMRACLVSELADKDADGAIELFTASHAAGYRLGLENAKIGLRELNLRLQLSRSTSPMRAHALRLSPEIEVTRRTLHSPDDSTLNLAIEKLQAVHAFPEEFDKLSSDDFPYFDGLKTGFLRYGLELGFRDATGPLNGHLRTLSVRAHTLASAHRVVSALGIGDAMVNHEIDSAADQLNHRIRVHNESPGDEVRIHFRNFRLGHFETEMVDKRRFYVSSFDGALAVRLEYDESLWQSPLLDDLKEVRERSADFAKVDPVLLTDAVLANRVRRGLRGPLLGSDVETFVRTETWSSFGHESTLAKDASSVDATLAWELS